MKSGRVDQIFLTLKPDDHECSKKHKASGHLSDQTITSPGNYSCNYKHSEYTGFCDLGLLLTCSAVKSR